MERAWEVQAWSSPCRQRLGCTSQANCAPEELTRFGEELRAAQLAACVAVSRDVYLNLWPDHADHIGDVKHVLVNGERRYRGACQVGLDALDFVVRDELAASRETFINHLLKENLDRADFDIIE